jgi:hypothetical protein
MTDEILFCQFGGLERAVSSAPRLMSDTGEIETLRAYVEARDWTDSVQAAITGTFTVTFVGSPDSGWQPVVRTGCRVLSQWDARGDHPPAEIPGLRGLLIGLGPAP